MDLLEAIIIGIIQGLTEFLPVSSSGHIELAKAIFGDDNMPSEGMLFTIVLHAATALSTVVIFRKDILEIFKGVFKFKFNEHWKFVIAIGISMVPAGIVGLLFEKELEEFLSSEFFPRFGGGIGMTRLARAYGLLQQEEFEKEYVWDGVF